MVLSYLSKSLMIVFFLWYVVDGTNVSPRLRMVISSSVRWCVDLLIMHFFLAAMFLLCVLPGLCVLVGIVFVLVFVDFCLYCRDCAVIVGSSSYG